MDNVTIISTDEFRNTYLPLAAPSAEFGGSTWDRTEVEGMDPRFVWSIIATDRAYAFVPGYEAGPVVGFRVTVRPWTEKNIRVEFDEALLKTAYVSTERSITAR